MTDPNVNFPPSQEWLQQQLETALPGIVFEIQTDYCDHVNARESFRGKFFMFDTLPQQVKKPFKEIVWGYTVLGKYSNGMYLHFSFHKGKDGPCLRTKERIPLLSRDVNNVATKKTNDVICGILYPEGRVYHHQHWERSYFGRLKSVTPHDELYSCAISSTDIPIVDRQELHSVLLVDYPGEDYTQSPRVTPEGDSFYGRDHTEFPDLPVAERSMYHIQSAIKLVAELTSENLRHETYRQETSKLNKEYNSLQSSMREVQATNDRLASMNKALAEKNSSLYSQILTPVELEKRVQEAVDEKLQSLIRENEVLRVQEQLLKSELSSLRETTVSEIEINKRIQSAVSVASEEHEARWKTRVDMIQLEKESILRCLQESKALNDKWSQWYSSRYST